jgi:hypothetical protein
VVELVRVEPAALTARDCCHGRLSHLSIEAFP